ncbi:MAG: hypothetical protein RSA52_00320 [Acetivibrio sp.]
MIVKNTYAISEEGKRKKKMEVVYKQLILQIALPNAKRKIK